MNEMFISWIWGHRQLDRELRTESGEPLVVLHPGDPNRDSGPDFFNARLRIGDTTWAGNVEIHVVSSDWYRHGHDADPAYDRVILHVVHDADRPVFQRNGEPVQTLVIRGKYPASIHDRYRKMMSGQDWIPCIRQLDPGQDFGFGLWAPALAVERLESKSEAIKHQMTACGNDWEEAFYRHLAASFGFRTNSMPLELLAKSLPLKVIRRHCSSVFQVEALLFGQAGMLGKPFSDEFPQKLKKEYQFLRGKYDLKPLEDGLWKFLRLRPANFPTIRISQLAGFICRMEARFTGLLETGSLHEIGKALDIPASAYWDDHYLFDRLSASRSKKMGEQSLNLLMINGVAPFLFHYGREKGLPAICESILEFLSLAPGERNEQTERWRRAGFGAGNALHSQALLHLKRNYCDMKRCLECRVGVRVLGEGEKGISNIE